MCSFRAVAHRLSQRGLTSLHSMRLPAGSRALGGLLYDLQTLLGVDVDVVTEKGLRPRIREQVMREAVPL